MAIPLLFLGLGLGGGLLLMMGGGKSGASSSPTAPIPPGPNPRVLRGVDVGDLDSWRDPHLPAWVWAAQKPAIIQTSGVSNAAAFESAFLQGAQMLATTGQLKPLTLVCKIKLGPAAERDAAAEGAYALLARGLGVSPAELHGPLGTYVTDLLQSEDPNALLLSAGSMKLANQPGIAKMLTARAGLLKAPVPSSPTTALPTLQTILRSAGLPY